MEKKEILSSCMKKGFLVDKEILESLLSFSQSEVNTVVEIISRADIREKIVTKDVLHRNFDLFNEFVSNNNSTSTTFFKNLGFSFDHNAEQEKSEVVDRDGNVKIIFSPVIVPKKIEVKDFVKHFRNRFEFLSKILQDKGLENLKSLRRIEDTRETQYVIVSITAKRVTKNKNIILEVEDLTGSSKILINQNKEDLYAIAQEILLDDVIAFGVSGNSEILFANEIVYPDSFLAEKKKAKKEELVAFISDVHVGSTMFLESNFLRFVKWLNGQEGTEEQKNFAKKVKYLFIVGDSIDGVGVYPGQEASLELSETKNQYKKLAEVLNLIRKDVKIILSPGQHDAVWIGEPQPIVEEKWAEDLHKMENLSLVSNPSLIEIGEGFKILVYHGASMHGIIEQIPNLRLNYGHDAPTMVTKEMLKRRHLAPMHGLCDYIPNGKKDPLLIDVIPDIVATGDQHRSEVSVYNNILLIASSCWQSKTPFEEKVGNNPDPCKVPIFNMKTREVKIFDFSDEGGETDETRN